MRLLDTNWLHGLWVVALIAALQCLWLVRRRRALGGLIAPGLLATALARAGHRPFRSVIRAALLSLAAALVVGSLARPAWNPTPKPVQRSGRDVVFLVDVSRSMLATDLAPSRLERAKIAIKDVLAAARGDRFGLIAFAGTAVVKCPLTTDYNFARIAVDDLSPDSVSRGGTLIGDAIRRTMDDLFTDPDGQTANDRFRDIILITDGEDHESFPVEAAAAAGKRGIRIIALGIGSDAGAPVPLRDERGRTTELTHDGHPVRSRLDPQTLQKIAEASAGGIFLNVGTGNIELDRIYQQLAANSERRAIADASAMRYTEGFQFLLIPALALLVLETFIRETAHA